MSLLRIPARSAHAAILAGVLYTAGACRETPPPAKVAPAEAHAAPRPANAAPPAVSASATAAATAAPSAVASASEAAPKPSVAKDPVEIAKTATGTRIWGKSRFTWIHPSPHSGDAWVGYLGLGGSVALKGGSLDAARVGGSGKCTWYAVEPSGFVCEGDTASVDPTEEVAAALIRDSGQADSPWPYEYGESLGAPRYTRIPTPDEMRKTEWDLVKHLEKVERARAAKTDEEIAAIDKAFVGCDFTLSGNEPPNIPEVSPFVREGRKSVALGSTISWIRQFDVTYPGGEHGLTTRTFLLTSDFAIVPKDRVRPYPRSAFKGTHLNDEVELPIAFFRKTEHPKYKQNEDGKMVQTGTVWPARAFAMLTGESVTVEGEGYWVTREEGIYAKATDATVVQARKPPTPIITNAEGRGTWLDISVLGGWLVAYEKTRPVFVTLISPGRGGVPFPGKDPLETASTPVGQFRVDGKFRWATMVSSSSSDLVHTDVQYVQNFHGPHALHGAYWHDKFGEPKSGGCVNLSPIDSKWIFEFTEPALPAGWHGLRSTSRSEYATVVYVHK